MSKLRSVRDRSVRTGVRATRDPRRARLPELRGQAPEKRTGPRGALATSDQQLNASPMAERTRPVSAPTPQTPSTVTDASTARFELPAAGFALVELFERVPDAAVKLEPAVANPDDHALLMIEADAYRAVDAALRSSPSVAAVERFGAERTPVAISRDVGGSRSPGSPRTPRRRCHAHRPSRGIGSLETPGSGTRPHRDRTSIRSP